MTYDVKCTILMDGKTNYVTCQVEADNHWEAKRKANQGWFRYYKVIKAKS